MQLLIKACTLAFILCANLLYAGNAVITGKVLNARTQQPVENVNIEITGTLIGSATNDLGEFKITGISPGSHEIRASCIGYKSVQRKITVADPGPAELIILLEPDIIEGESIIITAQSYPNHALHRESPVAFSRLDREQIRSRYTTGDLPELLKDLPGVWTSSAGIGETEMTLRGFSSDKIHFMINDIPMNDPEDQQMYWSDWAGLANIVRNIEVHRGPGFSLYGPNAIGGSLNLLTMGIEQNRMTSFRISTGILSRTGIMAGADAGKVFDTSGEEPGEVSRYPLNYVYSARFNSGPMYDGMFNATLFLERKAGNSYVIGTHYDGYTLGLEAEGLFEDHKLLFTFFIFTQSHGQAFALQDIDLLPTLGREYNRRNHDWQENSYTKPFWALKHEWRISDYTTLTSNVFYTLGKGADQSCANDLFDTETGKIDFQPSSRGNDAYAFGSHAQYLYSFFGLMTTDFSPGGPFFSFKGIPFENNENNGTGFNFFTDLHTHSYQDRRQRNHHQFGLVTYMSETVNSRLYLDFGLDMRLWRGHREGEVRMLKISDGDPYRPIWSPSVEDVFRPVVQSSFNYDTEVANLSPFGRATWKPSGILTLQTGVQLCYSRAEVIENPIRLIDFGSWGYFDTARRTTADQESYSRTFGLTNDYMRVYNYITPWIGGNLNISDRWHIFSRVAQAKKEPAILDWYDHGSGPLLQKEFYPENEKAADLVPETAVSFEAGFGYISDNLQISGNLYHTVFSDKIERVIDIAGRRTTRNAGRAIFQGIETSVAADFGPLDMTLAITLARNRWQEMNVRQIFDSDAGEITGKVVPFSPERISSLMIGYDIVLDARNALRFEVSGNYWDEYYGTYTNTYVKTVENIIDGDHFKELEIYPAKLPYFLDIGLQAAYRLELPAFGLHFKIDARNILNRRDNFMRAQYTIDYTRNDFQAGRYNWYVLQAPLFNIFFTTEIILKGS